MTEPVFRPRRDSPTICPMLVTRAHSAVVGKRSASWVRKSVLLILLNFCAASFATAQSVPGEPNLKALFALAGRTHNIDPDLLEAIAEVESRGDPLSVSRKGALGLMQLMPLTARTFSVDRPFDPMANVLGAADFLNYLRNRFAGSLNLQGVPTLVAAYNAGPRAVEKYGGIPPYAETQNYVRRVLNRYTSCLKAQGTDAAVLILTPKPYVIRIKPGTPIQPEPVLLNVDGDHSARAEVTAIRDIDGHVIGLSARGTARSTTDRRQ